ncbi:hypothetical protein ILFOPFJJ_01740 [Ensifer psoraleae]|uniref:hypothetical protein n=1 Tax=Sinorhizobium psoraleae TaxID=520838 RepID=UPI0015694B83|nr:hypothetical protein [Sinorhizobium psoraleae]NRP70858.1 hypothetical protein [Sinorhizobium psoraleae]
MGIFRTRNLLLLLSALGALWLGWHVLTGYAFDHASQHYLANGMVRIELPSGRKFNIPERYMYWEGYVKHGRWPKPKEGRVKVDGFNFDALLPDLRPYQEQDDALWRELGHGNKLYLYVHSKVFDGTSWHHVYDGQMESVRRGYAKRLDDENGLIKFLNLMGKGRDRKPYDVTYFTSDFKIKLECSYPGVHPSPGCTVDYIYDDHNYIHYRYSSEYFSDWKKIHNNLVNLIAQFERDGNSDSVE